MRRSDVVPMPPEPPNPAPIQHKDEALGVRWPLVALLMALCVVNPVWRNLDREIRTLQVQLTPKLARIGAMNLSAPIEPELVEAFLKKERKVAAGDHGAVRKAHPAQRSTEDDRASCAAGAVAQGRTICALDRNREALAHFM